MKHKHHINPRYRGGGNEPENLIEVSITQHIMWHYANWCLWGDKRDWIAWKALSGKINSEFARIEAAREYMKNRVVSEETKRKMSEVKKGNSFFSGKKHTDKSKEKMRVSAIKHRAKIIYCPELNIIWDSVVYASEDLGIPVKQIRKAASLAKHSERNLTAQGLHFRYICVIK